MDMYIDDNLFIDFEKCHLGVFDKSDNGWMKDIKIKEYINENDYDIKNEKELAKRHKETDGIKINLITEILPHSKNFQFKLDNYIRSIEYFMNTSLKKIKDTDNKIIIITRNVPKRRNNIKGFFNQYSNNEYVKFIELPDYNDDDRITRYLYPKLNFFYKKNSDYDKDILEYIGNFYKQADIINFLIKRTQKDDINLFFYKFHEENFTLYNEVLGKKIEFNLIENDYQKIINQDHYKIDEQPQKQKPQKPKPQKSKQNYVFVHKRIWYYGRPYWYLERVRVKTPKKTPKPKKKSKPSVNVDKNLIYGKLGFKDVNEYNDAIDEGEKLSEILFTKENIEKEFNESFRRT
jgi:hypothetical protein